ncbi:MAG: hypothetical protein JNG90_08290, partial [Planctomycetaceae bacterium]|nr:hypothetical protein [Planctomycetaceae bacterium]
WMPKSCCLAPARPARRGIGLLICLILAGVAVGMNTSRLAKQSRRTVAARADLERYTRQLAPRSSELYVTWASSYPFELLSPFDNLQSFADFHVFALSWPQATPVQQRLKQHFRVADIPRALYERADVKMIAEKDLWPLYARYVEEHHGLLVEIRPAGRAPGLQPEVQGSMRLASPISWRGITR